MTLRDIPIVPTIVVLAAAITMIWLGFWQLDRANQKEALLASYGAIELGAGAVPYPADDDALEASLYRKTSARCEEVLSVKAVAGTNTVGAKGWAHVADCRLEQGIDARVALGWSRDPQSPDWAGGVVSGTLGPGGKIVADPPLADLGPLAKPDPADLPNNHLAYAGQWFLFALTALVIYIIALRVRSKSAGRGEDQSGETITRSEGFTHYLDGDDDRPE